MASPSYVHWPLFRAILDNQSSRFTNFGGFFALVFNQRVVAQPFAYLPFLLGFMTLVADLREGRHVEMALFAVAYAVGIAFFRPWNDYGWYLIPLYPPMAFGLASFLVRASGTYLAWIAADSGLGKPSKLRYAYIGVAVLVPFGARCWSGSSRCSSSPTPPTRRASSGWRGCTRARRTDAARARPPLLARRPTIMFDARHDKEATDASQPVGWFPHRLQGR